MHVLIADALDRTATDALVAAGHHVVQDPSLTAETLVDALTGVQVLVVRSTRVTAEAIFAADALDLIVRAGSGVDNIDIGAASSRAINVCNVPGQNAAAVAELTMGLMLAVDRHIADGTADLRSGTWNKKKFQTARGMMGRTLGIIGLGEIGLGVAARAKAFGMTVVGVKRTNRSERTEGQIRQIGIRLVGSVEELVQESDVVSIHVPGSAATEGLVDEAFLALMKPGAILLNTSRGDIIDEAALIAALDEKGLRAGLDVYRSEPGAGAAEFASPLAAHPAVVGTHHIGASTDQAQEAVAAGVAEVIHGFVGGRLDNCLNVETNPQGSHSIRVRHRDRVGVLASVLGVLSASGLNVQQMENQVFRDSDAAVAIIQVQGEVDDETRMRVSALHDVFGTAMVETSSR